MKTPRVDQIANQPVGVDQISGSQIPNRTEPAPEESVAYQRPASTPLGQTEVTVDRSNARTITHQTSSTPPTATRASASTENIGPKPVLASGETERRPNRESQILIADEEFVFHEFDDIMALTRQNRGKVQRHYLCFDDLEHDYLLDEGGDKSLSYGQKKKQFDEIKGQSSTLLKQHFDETLARHQVSCVTAPDGAKGYTIKDGVAFWCDFLSSATGLTVSAARCFMKAQQKSDFAANLVAALTKKARTHVISKDVLGDTDVQNLLQLADHLQLKVSAHGPYIILGSGMSFHLTNDVFRSGKQITDPVLRERFRRFADFLASQLENLKVNQNQAAAAYFSPSEDDIAFVMPSRGGLNTLSHESTHARFQKFQLRVASWAKTKGYTIPYEVDGPANGLASLFGGSPFGGYMNLLNELNSWRTGESFDGKNSDEEILKTLRDFYGQQAGAEAARLFTDVWPTSTVAGKSVPALIHDKIVQFNSLAENDLAALGETAIKSGNLVSQENFLRLAAARYHASADMPNGMMESIQALTFSNHESVKSRAESLCRKLEADSTSSAQPGDIAASDQMYAKVSAWAKGLISKQAPVVPYDISSELFYVASQENFLSVEDALEHKSAYGCALMSESKRPLFENVLSQPGATFAEKLQSYLSEFNDQNFDSVWQFFLQSLSYDCENLITEKHLDNIDQGKLQTLCTRAIDEKNSSRQRQYLDVMAAFLEKKLGLATLYSPRDQHSLTVSQVRTNKKNNVPINSYLTKTRKPDPSLWVFRALDPLLAEKMLDGKPGMHRLAVMNFIRSHTYPNELPQLFGKVVDVLKKAPATVAPFGDFDFWMARAFLTPEKNLFYKSHTAWGEALVDEIQKIPDPQPTTLEFAADFYRLTLGDEFAVNVGVWGDFNRFHDAKERATFMRVHFTQGEREKIRDVSTYLWDLMGHDNEKVRLAAIYASATCIAYLTAIEDRILGALQQTDDAKHREAAMRLVSMMEPGFSPTIDAYLASADFVAQNSLETDLLQLRGHPSHSSV